MHNHYKQAGGEDAAVRAEHELLQRYGHSVELLEADNTQIDGFSARAKTAFSAIYSPASRVLVEQRLAAFQPDLIHVHNFFPQLSPSIYSACRRAGVPVVQTLHNFRLICPNAQLLRGGRICEDCVGRKVAWPGVLHACYRRSHLGSAAVAAMLATHRTLRTWENSVDRFIALTNFSREKLIQGGLPAGKIAVKPNFVWDTVSPGCARGRFALFVGRLSPEKGVDLLLTAWKRAAVDFPLKLIGDGPLAKTVTAAAQACGAEYLGHLPPDHLRALMGQASFLIVPSICYENLPFVVVEAFAAGVPVIVAGHGGIALVVEHGRTGLHFRAGDVEHLATTVRWAVNHAAELERMRAIARQEYLSKYTPQRNYEKLMEIYAQACGSAAVSEHGTLSEERVGVSGLETPAV